MIPALRRVIVPILVLLGISGLPSLADTAEAWRVYDIQVGYLADPANADRLVDRLKFRRPDPAQGMFQILRSTACLIYEEWIWKRMWEPRIKRSG
jgi:hypothetical protein